MTLVVHGRDRTPDSSGSDSEQPNDDGPQHGLEGRQGPSAPADDRAAVGASGAERVDVDPAFVRSPEFLARLVVFGAAFAALALAARVADEAFMGLGRDLGALAAAAPSFMGALVTASVSTIALGLVVAAAMAGYRRDGLRAAAVLAVAAVAAGAVVLGALSFAEMRGWVGSMNPVPIVVTAAAVAALVISREQLPTAALHIGRGVLVSLSIVSGLWTEVPVPAALLALVGSAFVASAVALVAGTPSRMPTAATVKAGMEAAGLRVDHVAGERVDARASVPWRARLSTGREVFVKTRSAEERSADLMFRSWRVIRWRGTGDELPDTTLRRAVEHEAFVAQRAAAVGVRTPKLVAIGRLDGGGMFAAFEAIDADTLEDIGRNDQADQADQDGQDGQDGQDDRTDPATRTASAVTASVLRATWSMVQILHRAGVAHRDLRAANVMVDAHGDPWIIDFGFSEVAATEEQMHRDVVELLASSAALVGPERAVAAAVDVLGHQRLAEVVPLVQPAALCAATRRALGREGCADLRRAVLDAAGVPEPDAPRLQRVSPKTALSIAALGIALWVLLPQIADSGAWWSQVTDAHLGWASAALAASFLSYVSATAGLAGASPTRIPWGSTLVTQLASSFTNRITPAQVGGVALNIRFLARTGMGTASATTAVGLSAAAGAVVHVTLMVFTAVWAGSMGAGDLVLPSPRTLVVTGGCVLGLVVVGLVVPTSRRFLIDRLQGPLRQSGNAVATVARDPAKLALLFGGSLGITALNTLALVASLQAFGIELPIATIAVVYLAGAAVGAAAPTPGGLGATEAALVAGFTAVGVPSGPAVAGVLVFRLATFWIPILPGWVAFSRLQRRGAV